MPNTIKIRAPLNITRNTTTPSNERKKTPLETKNAAPLNTLKGTAPLKVTKSTTQQSITKNRTPLNTT